MKEEEARRLATEIAKDLFTNGFDDHAARLVLINRRGQDLGEWSEKSVIERLTRWIQVPRKVKRP